MAYLPESWPGEPKTRELSGLCFGEKSGKNRCLMGGKLSFHNSRQNLQERTMKPVEDPLTFLMIHNLLWNIRHSMSHFKHRLTAVCSPHMAETHLHVVSAILSPGSRQGPRKELEMSTFWVLKQREANTIWMWKPMWNVKCQIDYPTQTAIQQINWPALEVSWRCTHSKSCTSMANCPRLLMGSAMLSQNIHQIPAEMIGERTTLQPYR